MGTMRFCMFFVCLFLQIEGRCQNYNAANKNTSGYILSGKIKGIDTGWLYLKHRQTNKIDSAKIENGAFKITGKSETPEFCNIGTGNNGSREFYFGFFLQAGRMKMRANKNSLFDAAVSFEGSPTQDEFKKFQQKMRLIDSLSYQTWLEGKTAINQDSINLKSKELDKTRKEMIWDYSLKHPQSYISAFEAFSYLTEKEDLPRLKCIFNQMNPALQRWFYSSKINQRLQEHTDG